MMVTTATSNLKKMNPKMEAVIMKTRKIVQVKVQLPKVQVRRMSQYERSERRKVLLKRRHDAEVRPLI